MTRKDPKDLRSARWFAPDDLRLAVDRDPATVVDDQAVDSQDLACGGGGFVTACVPGG